MTLRLGSCFSIIMPVAPVMRRTIVSGPHAPGPIDRCAHIRYVPALQVATNTIMLVPPLCLFCHLEENNRENQGENAR